MNQTQMHELARGAIECHLGDVADEGDSLYDNAFVLAHDALLDAGVEPKEATRIASYEAQLIAQP